MTARKPKTCKHCRREFVPSRPMQKVCSPLCALGLAQSERAKQERRDLIVARAKAKPRERWLREAQASFNAWVRARDAHLPCISCGRHHAGQNHAGHYRSVGSAPHLRFDARNVHRQCAPCNTHLHGNAIAYRIGLIARIGLEAVEALEADQTPRKYTTDELAAIKAEYARKRREIEKAREAA